MKSCVPVREKYKGKYKGIRGYYIGGGYRGGDNRSDSGKGNGNGNGNDMVMVVMVMKFGNGGGMVVMEEVDKLKILDHLRRCEQKKTV